MNLFSVNVALIDKMTLRWHTMESRLDHIYRRVLLTKFFTRGWGSPDHLVRWAVIGRYSKYWLLIGKYSKYWLLIGWYSEYWLLIGCHSKYWLLIGCQDHQAHSKATNVPYIQKPSSVVNITKEERQDDNVVLLEGRFTSPALEYLGEDILPLEVRTL